MNKVIISGTSTKDTELQTSANGTPYCRFTLAVNRDYNDEEGNPITDFFNFVVFKQQAEFLAKYLTKGSKACVEGTLITTDRELKDGSRIKQIDIRVKNVELFYIKRRDQQQGCPRYHLPYERISHQRGHQSSQCYRRIQQRVLQGIQQQVR